MKYFLAFIFTSMALFGQRKSDDNRIVVLGEASTQIPADQILFYIYLNFSDSENIQTPYNEHKIAEGKLLEFLKTKNVPNKNITYSTISISQQTHHNPETNKQFLTYQTNQSINVKIDNVNQYAEFMISLINAGFKNVNTSFTSSKEDEFNDTLITKAIEVAKSKANVMAKASDRQIKRIIKIMDTDETDPNFGFSGEAYASVVGYNDKGITQIPQTIAKSYSVKVVFELK